MKQGKEHSREIMGLFSKVRFFFIGFGLILKRF
jgi:hypothetical protein